MKGKKAMSSCGGGVVLKIAGCRGESWRNAKRICPLFPGQESILCICTHNQLIAKGLTLMNFFFFKILTSHKIGVTWLSNGCCALKLGGRY